MWARCGLGCVVLLVAAACTEKDTTGFPVVTAGSGGSASSVGGSSGSGGNGGGAGTTAGSGGSMDGGAPDAGAPRLRAVLEGQEVKLTALDPIWLRHCDMENPRLVQRANDAWTLLVDDRPDGTNLQQDAHYLDGAYHSACRLSAGCDVAGCAPLSEFEEDYGQFQFRLTAREYVQTGEQRAPTCEQGDAGFDADGGSDAGGRSVPAIESRAPAGPLGVRLVYYLDSACQTQPVSVDIPVE